MLVRARAAAAASATGLEVDAAAEGGELVLTPGGRPLPHLIEMPAATEVPALEHFDVGVAVVTSDPALVATVHTAAEAEGLAVRDLEAPLAEDPEHTIMVLDVDDGPSRGRLAGGWSVLGATRQAIPKANAHVTDWLVLPCTTAHVRTKLRAAVLRRACRWMAAPLPEDEDRRLAALRALDILDTPPEARFDQYTELARRATDTPIALVTLVDADRQWFKSHLGFDVTESPRDQSMCAHAILDDDVLVVADTLEDDRFADNPAVTGPARIRFYAGVPLVLADGSRVGTLCVGDHRPRLLDEAQLHELRRLAALVVAELQPEDV